MSGLKERHRQVLFHIVDTFVRSGEPVSSGAVAQQSGLGVSAATIRNVMGDLEHMGLLMQPHTSAGRVPTTLGMRVYVDALPDGAGAAWPGAMWSEGLGGEVDDAAKRVGGLLSQLVQLTTLVTLPGFDRARLHGVRLTGLVSGWRVLVELELEAGRVVHRVVQMAQPVSGGELGEMQDYLSGLVVGLTLGEVRERVQREQEEAAQRYSAHLRVALELGKRALEAAEPGLVVEGKLRFFEYAEFQTDVGRLGSMLQVLEQKERMLALLDRLCEASRPAGFMGPELDGWAFGPDVSLIVCGYSCGGERSGVLGLLGPVRMDYARVIPLVAQAAQTLSEVVMGRAGEVG
jgi:heat-inducible transcriptional repressor